MRGDVEKCGILPPRVYHTIPFIICLCCLIGCQNPAEPGQPTLPANTGIFSLAVNSRTILPAAPALADFAVYELAFTAASGGADLTADRTNATLAANPFILVAGTYDLTVCGYKDTAKTQLMARGTLSGIVISAGGSTAKSVTLTPVLGEAGTSGDFSWDITIDTTAVTVSTASMTIQDSAGVQPDVVVDLAASPASGNQTLASGLYTVRFAIEGTENGKPMAMVYNELLYVYAGLTSRFPSSGTFTFNDTYFHNTHWNITFDENYSGGGSAVQSVPHGGAYTVADTPARSGYAFNGWDTVMDGSGTRYMPGDSITNVSADMTLYAQWFSYVVGLIARLEALPAGTADSPTAITLDPAVFTTAASVPDGAIGWGDITAAVKNAAKYVTLDLSNISFDGNTVTGVDSTNPTGNNMNTVKSDYIKGIILPSSLTGIGDYAFRSCAALTGVTIPPGVASIGNSAFFGCSALTSVDIPSGITSIEQSAFSDCAALTSVTIPSGVTSIGSSAFSRCSALTSVDIPSGVTSIGASAFSTCRSLTSITIPSGVTSIMSSTFHNCSGLTSITISPGVESIEASAFYGCSGLTSIDIPASVTSLKPAAFSYCTALTRITVDAANTVYADADGVVFNKDITTVVLYPLGKNGTPYTIPDSVTSIGQSAFSGCTALTGVTIPNGVTSIAQSAFLGCTALTGVTIPDGVTSIEQGAFQSCTALASVTIHNGVTSIGNAAFRSCTSLTGITIPSGVASIGSSAFADCKNLASINIPDSVFSIATYAFQNCTALAGATISSGVTSIAVGTFLACKNLISVTFNGGGVTTFGSSAFVDAANTTALSTAYTDAANGGAGNYTCTDTTTTDWARQP